MFKNKVFWAKQVFSRIQAPKVIHMCICQ